MPDEHIRLYAELAKALGLSDLGADDSGAVQITVGEDAVVLFAENDLTVTVVAPVVTLPDALDHGRILWLLRRNHYDSPIAPFRISCNPKHIVTVWGRIPIEGLSGADFALLLDGLVTEVVNIREELAIDVTATDAKLEPASA